MSTPSAAARGTDNAPVSDRAVHERPSGAGLATFIAVVAAVLALVDLFHAGLGRTVLHLVVALTTFGVVRYCVGLSLDPLPYADDDCPETRP